jgi:hypothetical protein
VAMWFKVYANKILACFSNVSWKVEKMVIVLGLALGIRRIVPD